ncbi:hypothetical protein PSTG_00193 [Puccinia striiformis f. sp. tritici PST-78]|uniref:F-box domain-containing protein n=1 Tax=Puccinia striiformis f. sp. tritici PST-78 TaxID=1165861 RepID=A0A0L0W5V8_9BASI|nr:hypothetical protein PSTG_00193 [Puccinia striiformis f. sp. tritici PST-78]
MNPSAQSQTATLARMPTEIKMLIIEYVVIQTEKKLGSETHEPLPLALVDRSFYKLCSPFNWHELNLLFQCIPCLKRLIHQSLPRHVHHVRSIIIGLHEEPTHQLRLSLADCQFPENELRHLLEICTNLTKVSIWLDSAWLDMSGEFLITGIFPTSTLLHPISQLFNLTHIVLNNHTGCALFEEEFLVKLLGNMVHLVSIRTNYIRATYPTCECISPLATQLASLLSLKSIHLSYTDCFDLGWSKIKWNGALEEITLRRCYTSLREVHAFCSLFEESLVHVSLDHAPQFSDLQNAYEMTETMGCVFRLPRLKRLSIRNEFIVPFLKLFRGSHNIFRINIIETCNPLSLQDIKSLIGIDEPIWLQLTSLLVHVDKRTFSRKDKEELVEHGLKAGVKVECGTLNTARQPFFEEDQFSFEMDNLEASDSQNEG